MFLFSIFGELLEFLTGALSTKEKLVEAKAVYGFRIIGSVVGSLAGIFIGIPIPIIGSLIAALLFSGAGALLGAYYGELVDRGRNFQEAWKVGISKFCR